MLRSQLAVSPQAAVHFLHHRLQPQLELVHILLVLLMLLGHLGQEVHPVLQEELPAMRGPSLARSPLLVAGAL